MHLINSIHFSNQSTIVYLRQENSAASTAKLGILSDSSQYPFTIIRVKYLKSSMQHVGDCLNIKSRILSRNLLYRRRHDTNISSQFTNKSSYFLGIAQYFNTLSIWVITYSEGTLDTVCVGSGKIIKDLKLKLQ